MSVGRHVRAGTTLMTRLPACKPHSFESDDSHHHRPALRSVSYTHLTLPTSDLV
mgnify:CR=1 FL=1